MKVILLEDVKNLGSKGEEVSVGDGYAMNYLIPQRKAVDALSAQGAQMQQQRMQKQDRREKEVAEERTSIANLPTSITIAVPANEEGGLFSSVTAEVLKEHLGEAGTAISVEHITVPLIKRVGEYVVTIAGGEEEKRLAVVVKSKQ